MVRDNFFKIILWGSAFAVLVIFNIWHITKIRIWDPPTVYQSLHLSEKVVERFKESDPKLESSGLRNDGEFVYAALYDPLLLRLNNLDLFDNAGYRYKRIAYTWAAYIASWGNPHRFAYALLVVNILAYLGGAVIVFFVCQKLGLSLWLIVGYTSLSGLLFSTFWTLTEPFAFFLSLAGLLAWLSRKDYVAICLWSLAVLGRETSLLVPMAALLFSVKNGHRSPTTALKYFVAILTPYLLWTLYIYARLPAYATLPFYPTWGPDTPGIGRFTFPFLAIWIEGKHAFYALTTNLEKARTLSILFFSVAAILFTLARFRFSKSIWAYLAVTQALFLIVIRGDLWNYYMGSMRIVFPLFFFLMAWCVDEVKRES